MSQKELLNGQNSVEETQNNSNSTETLIERIKVEGTPFWIIGEKGRGYFLIMGNTKITETRVTIAEVKEDMIKEMYNIIFRMTGTIVEKMIEETYNNKKNEE